MSDYRLIISRAAQWAILGLVTLLILVTLIPMGGRPDGYDLNMFGKLPVVYGGRHKPIDTVARNTLTVLSGRQTVKRGERKLSATEWLLDISTTPATTRDDPIFRVDNQSVRAAFGQAQAPPRQRFSYQQILPARDIIAQRAQRLSQTDRSHWNSEQRETVNLSSKLRLYESLANRSLMLNIPVADGEDWVSYAEAAATSHGGDTIIPELVRYARVFEARRVGNASVFNTEVAALHQLLLTNHPRMAQRDVAEWHFNRIAPFNQAKWLYILVAVLVFVSWLALPKTLQGAAVKLMAVALIIHTAGLIVRIILSGRPPVTNLYSSALGVGWVVAALSLFVERFLKHGFGLVVGATFGFATLLVAQGLSADGDTMAVLRAVLDTNFWLATHVIVIVLGYGATFAAGTLGVIYILTGVFTTTIDRELSRRLGQVIYGVVCFGILLSFIGTILGGIWADQSWGRFWGWDPKENGALMIVLWNAIVLHARWGGLVRERGVAVLAVFGNIVTLWSWFGTNMLGTGLHAYGFTDPGSGSMWDKLLNPGPKEWLVLVVMLHIVFIAIGTMPMEAWRSHKTMLRRPTPTPEPSGGG